MKGTLGRCLLLLFLVGSIPGTNNFPSFFQNVLANNNLKKTRKKTAVNAPGQFLLDAE